MCTLLSCTIRDNSDGSPKDIPVFSDEFSQKIQKTTEPIREKIDPAINQAKILYSGGIDQAKRVYDDTKKTYDDTKKIYDNTVKTIQDINAAGENIKNTVEKTAQDFSGAIQSAEKILNDPLKSVENILQ